MAVPEQIPLVDYVADGTVKKFDVPFDYDMQEDLHLFVDSVEPTIDKYFLQDNAFNFYVAPTVGQKVRIERITPEKRDTDYDLHTNTIRPKALNNDFDRIWYKVQELGVKDWLLDLKIQKFRDDVNLTALEETLAQAELIRDETAESVIEVQNNVAQSQSLLTETTTQAGAAALSASVAVSAKDEAVIAATNATNEVNNLQEYVDNAVGAISTDASKQYATLALATADIANISINKNVFVSEESNGGYWYKATAEAITLTKSPYDPLTQAKAYADANGLFKPITLSTLNTEHIDTYKTKGIYIIPSTTVAENMGLTGGMVSAGFLIILSNTDGGGLMTTQKFIPQNSNSEFIRTSNVSGVFPSFQKNVTADLLNKYALIQDVQQLSNKPYDVYTPSKNLYNAALKIVDKYINSSGNIATAIGWSISDYIPVIEGQYYTISSTSRRVGLSWFSEKTTTGSAYNASTTNPLIVQAPVGAKYLVINIDSTSVTGVNVQVESGQIPTAYEPYGNKYQVDSAYVVSKSKSVGSLSISGNSAKISGYIENQAISLDLLLTRDNTHSQSIVFNFLRDTINNVVQRNPTDDTAPFRMDGTTIGSNHGYQKSDLTLIGHGKTTSDIGSVWSSAGKEYVIVDIISSDVLSITARADNTAFILGTLTHVSGAVNTAAFTPTATVSSQWYQVFKNRRLSVFVDDELIDTTLIKAYPFKREVSFHESYELFKKSDLVEWLISNKGQNYVEYGAIPCSMVNYSYAFDHECGCTIYASLTGYKAVPFIDMMGTQSNKIASGVVSYYVPKTIPFVQDSVNYDFTQLTPMISNPTSSIYFTAARNESGVSPVDRLLQLNDQVGYATGYLPILDAEPSIRPVNASNKYLEIRNTSLKIYPRLIDGLKTELVEGDSFACVAYRKYFLRNANRTSNYVVRSKMGDYLYLDWHAAKTDIIYLPDDLIGRDFTVHEKSSNVTLLTKFSTNAITVKVDSSKNYGYLVLKFK